MRNVQKTLATLMPQTNLGIHLYSSTGELLQVLEKGMAEDEAIPKNRAMWHYGDKKTFQIRIDAKSLF